MNAEIISNKTLSTKHSSLFLSLVKIVCFVALGILVAFKFSRSRFDAMNTHIHIISPFAALTFFSEMAGMFLICLLDCTKPH